MAKIVLIWLTCSTLINVSYSLDLEPYHPPSEYHGFCTNMYLNKFEKLKHLENCTVVIGDLRIVRQENTSPKDFVNKSFPKLKEVTGYLVVYRVFGLESLHDLLPNLSRIRGNTLLEDYALVVFEMPNLREINLSGLFKIDQGGVVIWGAPYTCFIDTIDWNVIAPNSRHVLSKSDEICNFRCSCTRNLETNKCWNNKKCQIFLEGPDSYNCSSKCLGCRRTNSTMCTLCRQFSYNQTCMSRCPNNAHILAGTNYCVTVKECVQLRRWVWNNTCVSECPNDFVRSNSSSGLTTCVSCPNCHQICGNLQIQALAQIHDAEKCVYVNGSLKIHIGSIPNVANEMRYYLRNIVEVSDYIYIHSSINLVSLDFLPSLKRIKGRHLYADKYSLVIFRMRNLQTLFLPNVTQNLQVDRGTLKVFNNSMLCMSEIKKLKGRFPKLPNEIDIPQGLNGFSGGCNLVTLDLKVRERNETFAIATFRPLSKDVHYTLLYIKIPRGINCTVVPETCSDFEWFAIHIFDTSKDIVEVPLPHLHPASNYALCIEQYEPTSRQLSRSSIVKFRTLVGIPEPPFILELVASTPTVIVVSWVDHLDYSSDIIRYELDVILIDINEKHLRIKDFCAEEDKSIFEIDNARHVKIMRPPRNYENGCESMCGVLSSAPAGAMVEDYFDVCSTIKNCTEEPKRPKNLTMEGVVVTLALEINGAQKKYQIGGLAPFRDYRVRLRGCTKNLCSRSVSNTVRTLHSQTADVAFLISASANTSGFVFLKWDSAKTTNGPILSYTIEIVYGAETKAMESSDFKYLVPKTWCLPGNVTNVSLKVNVASKYIVRVCSTTLAHRYVCNEWTMIIIVPERMFVVHVIAWWWSGVLVGMFICVFSCVVGYKLRNRRSDTTLLIDPIYLQREESDPPANMFRELHDVS